jgi:eukaryotic-like serine/threonine-protein kinase
VGPYAIIAPLGAGGMGEVYRGRDSKLDRDVAIKILPDALARDPERLARFEREAKVLASLNHPNIAHIYGIEESDGVRALVMELIPGQTLADAEKSRLPLATALDYACHIAEALETAHEKGVVHRDLKPANVMITPEGLVKVVDFGLAAIPSRDGAGGSDPHNSPTFTMAATQAGFILGTAGYMAPEQAAGKPVDKRADIWAFGVVLYEMLTGQRLFDGETVSHTLADVLRAPIDFGKLPKDTPPAIRNLVERCLDRNVKNRLRDIGEARVIIERVGKEPAGAPPQTAPIPVRSGGKLAWGVAGIFALAAIALAVIHFRETPPAPRVVRFQIPVPEKLSDLLFDLSPDGRTLAFSASQGGRRQIWLRPLDSTTAHPLSETDGATYVFWSPDSAYLAFFVPGKLKKIAVSGGPSQTLCDAPGGRGGTWSKDGVIVFSPGLVVPLMRVSSAGGAPTPVTTLSSSNELQRFPSFLPDGKHFLFEVANTKPEINGIYAGSLDGSPRVRLTPDTSSAIYAAPADGSKSGMLLFRREGALMAEPFNPRAVRATGEVFPVAEQVVTSGNSDHLALSTSSTGVLAYSDSLSFSGGTLAWADRDGKRTPIGQPAPVVTQALSPDGKQVAMGLLPAAGGDSDLWMLDVARGLQSRFTFRPGRSVDAVWSPDGAQIAYNLDNRTLYRKPANGAGTEELLVSETVNGRPQDWSRDGKFLVYMETGGKTGNDLWILPMEEPRKPVPYLKTPFDEADAQFSPDGRWMAYTSNESGMAQVYVQSIPASGTKFQISSTGGGQPRWSRDGKELFYISAENKLMAVPVKIGATIETDAPKQLFDLDPIYPPLAGRWAYEPSPDGQRFLTLSSSRLSSNPVTLVLNWQAAFKR